MRAVEKYTLPIGAMSRLNSSSLSGRVRSCSANMMSNTIAFAFCFASPAASSPCIDRGHGHRSASSAMRARLLSSMSTMTISGIGSYVRCMDASEQIAQPMLQRREQSHAIFDEGQRDECREDPAHCVEAPIEHRP